MIIKSGRRGGPVEPPPPPRMSWQGTNLLSSLKQLFFFPSPLASPPLLSPTHSLPLPPLTSAQLRTLVNISPVSVSPQSVQKKRMADGARRKSGGGGRGWGAWRALGKASCSGDAPCHALSGRPCGLGRPTTSWQMVRQHAGVKAASNGNTTGTGGGGGGAEGLGGWRWGDDCALFLTIFKREESLYCICSM